MAAGYADNETVRCDGDRRWGRPEEQRRRDEERVGYRERRGNAGHFEREPARNDRQRPHHHPREDMRRRRQRNQRVPDGDQPGYADRDDKPCQRCHSSALLPILKRLTTVAPEQLIAPQQLIAPEELIPPKELIAPQQLLPLFVVDQIAPQQLIACDAISP